MSYPFVQAFHDAGRRSGPIRGFTVHMAEGGGTVGFLAKRNPNGVSVHYVIERSGRTVQMLHESHMHTSIRIKNANGTSAIRQSNDPDGFYGVTAAAGVLGDWYDTRKTLGPNHATIAVELEGFAEAGPNPDQERSLIRLTNDIRSRYPDIGLLGHRDHNVKACPGRRIPWPEMGGHGPASQEEPVLNFTWVKDQPDSVPGTVTVRGDGHSAILADGTLFPLGAGATKHSYGLVRFKSGPRPGELAYAVGDDCAFLLKADVVYVAGQVSDAKVNAALDHVEGPAKAVLVAISEARPR